MATTEEMENEILAEMAEDPEAYSDGPVNDIIMIDAESRTINVPASESLFGVEFDKDVERKYFKCPKIVGDNIDLSKHKIYISYITSNAGGTTFTGKPERYYCDDMAADGDYITFSWKLSGNVFKNHGFIAFKVFAATMDGENVKTRWNTTAAIGTVRMTVPDGEDIVEEYPDIVTQLLERMDKVEEIATPEAMQGYVDTYLGEHPVQLDETLTESGKAADAKVVGEKFSQLSDTIEELTKKLDINSGNGLTATVKNALLEVVANVAWATAEGQACYDKLKTALNESVGEVELSSITATCSETAQVGTTASDLDIVVTAVYSDGSSAQVTGWTTSGTVVEGTNTFVVSYDGKSTTVTVTGVNVVAVTLEKYTESVTQLKSTTYTDDGNTPVASSGQWYINTTSGAFIQSTPLDEDVTVNISCIPDTVCYNGAWVGQVDDGYGLVPSEGNAKQANVYYYKSVASQMLVDTEYSLSNYTIKSGNRLIWCSGGKNTVTPTVEVVS